MNRTQTLKYSKRGKRVPSSESFGVVLKVTNLLISSVTSFPSAPNSQTSLIYVLSWGEDSRGSEGKVPPFISSYNRRVYIIPGDLSVPPTLFSGSEPRRTTTCSLDWKKKNNWKVAIFRPSRRSLLPRRPGWTDRLLIFF